MIVLDICILIITFLGVFHFKGLFRDFSRSERRFLNYLYLYHYFIAVVFHFYIENFGGDAIHYWDFASESSLSEIMSVVRRGSASGVIYLINYIPANILQLSFFTGNMLYAGLGYIGFVYLFRILRHFLGEYAISGQFKMFRVSLLPLIWFLPNLHFWSSGIGKDSILFFCIAAFIYAILNIRKRLLLFGISMVLSLAIRPHITLFLIISFGIGYVIDGRLKGYQKILILLVFMAGLVSTFNYVLEFVQLESLETTAINEFASKRAASLSRAGLGSGVDISSYPLPLKVFTFLYRPLFFDINGIFAVVASFENLFLLLFTGNWLFSGALKQLRSASAIVKGMLIFFLLTSISFSLILGNLGIMLRQKNQLIPILLLLGLITIYLQLKAKTSES